ncbi:MAG TPA: response regulator [Bryobacteraceae bacterium]|jgi:DNA-binding response OmpR family regulator|nr:response regulator [Bryobacteraceae bacterium]
MRTLLIVEDAGSCATTLEIALAQIDDLSVRLAASAEEAQLVLEADGDVCAIITDVHLPKASGLDLISWVRRRAGKRLPVLVISGDSDPDTPVRAKELGADAYFVKPFSPSEVRLKLEDLIHEHASPPHVS